MSANLLTIINKYNTEAKCIALLEQIRWGKTVTCVFCGSKKTKVLKGRSRRHLCEKCNHTFSVKMNTIFEAQLLNYMNLLKVPKGVLINFNCSNIFKEGQKTLVNEYFRKLPEY